MKESIIPAIVKIPTGVNTILIISNKKEEREMLMQEEYKIQ
jgi:hypothetical protein